MTRIAGCLSMLAICLVMVLAPTVDASEGIAAACEKRGREMGSEYVSTSRYAVLMDTDTATRRTKTASLSGSPSDQTQSTQ